MDLDLDLTSLGLRPASERTLGALKRSAAAAATATRSAFSGNTPGFVPARAAPTLVPPSPQLAAGLEALAGLGSPAPPPRPQPTGATPVRVASVDDLLGDLLSPPPPPARPHAAGAAGGDRAAKSTPAPRLGEAFDPFFGAPPLAARPVPAAPRPAESTLDDLESFAAGAPAQRGAAEAPASPPPPPPRPARAGSGGGASPVVRRASVGATAAGDLLSGAGAAAASAAAAVAAAAAAAFMRSAPDADDDFFSGGQAPASPRVPARPARRASSGDACLSAAADFASAPQHAPQPQPAVADPDDLDFFAGGAAAAAAVAAEAPAAASPPVFGGLDDLAAAPRAGKAVSSDPLDALFAPAPAAAAGGSRHGGTGAVAPPAAGAPRPRTDVSRWGTPVTAAHVAAAVDASVFANQGENEAIDPNEPPERAALRRKRHEAARTRVEEALREKLERDAVAAAEAAERHAVSAQVGPRLESWTRVGKGNIRLYLTSVQDVLWEGNTWKPIGMTELVSPEQVKRAWKRVLVNIHPDKVQQKGGTAAHRFVADKVFHTMLEAYNAFAAKELA